MVTFEQILELVRKAKMNHEYLDITISPSESISLFNNNKDIFLRTNDGVNYFLSYMKEVHKTDIDAECLEILVFGKKLGGD